MTATAPAPLLQVQKNAVDRALRVIAAAGCKFKVIEPDGTQHGALEVAPERTRSRKNFRHPPGTMHAHYHPHIAPMAPNDCHLVPFGRFTEKADRDSLRSSICAWASQHWGNDTYETHATADGVEVFRFR